jgi:diaminopimelate decarboxylase
MTEFTYRDNKLFAESIALSALGEQYGTPSYIYSRAAIEAAFMAYRNALEGCDHLVCYAVKANSNLAVLNVLSASARVLISSPVANYNGLLPLVAIPARWFSQAWPRQPLTWPLR